MTPQPDPVVVIKIFSRWVPWRKIDEQRTYYSGGKKSFLVFSFPVLSYIMYRKPEKNSFHHHSRLWFFKHVFHYKRNMLFFFSSRTCYKLALFSKICQFKNKCFKQFKLCSSNTVNRLPCILPLGSGFLSTFSTKNIYMPSVCFSKGTNERTCSKRFLYSN